MFILTYYKIHFFLHKTSKYKIMRVIRDFIPGIKKKKKNSSFSHESENQQTIF